MPTDRVAARWLLCLLLCAAGAARGGELRATVKTNDGQPVANAVVVAVPASGQYPDAVVAAARNAAVAMDQVNKEFVPFVEPVFVGSSVHFPNKDNIRHQVYSFSPAKRFELPLYAGTPAKPVLFDKPGVVTLGCNIHDWMIGYIYVSETPWFAKTDAQGSAVIDALPAGRYRVRVWHPDMVGSQQDTVRDVAAGDGSVTESWSLALKEREVRPRRAPLPGPGGYR